MTVLGLIVSVLVSVAVWTLLGVGLYRLVQDTLRKVRLPARRMVPRRSVQRAG